MISRRLVKEKAGAQGEKQLSTERTGGQIPNLEGDTVDKLIFMHEDLNVYKQALDFARDADSISAAWGSHCITDHFIRAAESIVINIAGGVAASTSDSKTQRSEYALGSTAECAACLDMARAWNTITTEMCEREKGRLNTIYAMLWKLRQSWLSFELRDEPIDPPPARRIPIGHEKLDVYKAGIKYICCLDELFRRTPPPDRFIRSLDASATSIVLNIAEGNSRISVSDRHRFFRDGDAANTKAAALLDLCHRPGQSADADRTIAGGKLILSRIGTMLGGLLK